MLWRDGSLLRWWLKTVTYMPGKVREILSIITEVDDFGTKGWLFIRFMLWD